MHIQYISFLGVTSKIVPVCESGVTHEPFTATYTGLLSTVPLYFESSSGVNGSSLGALVTVSVNGICCFARTASVSLKASFRLP